MTGWILLGLLVALGLVVAMLYNGLVKRRNRIEAAWVQIDVQRRRRSDLIPTLVETVQGYATHENKTLDTVTRARAAALEAGGVAEQSRAENNLTTALKSLFAMAEAYPDLKADQGFLSLQEELSGTEGRIGYARQFYNDTVRDYNTRIQSFPSLAVARTLRYREREYFEADDATRGPVQVDV